MKKELKTFIKDVLKLYKNNSYSQEGEDLILHKIFPDKKDGFYIDIGAHHPFRFSNTYYFYTKGWSGINIDAAPNSMNSFNKYRTRDINIEVAIGETEQNLIFYQFNDPALNTFDKELAESRVGVKYKIISEVKIQTLPLKTILQKYEIPKIDFMTIDVEGLELQVLMSNDWKKYKPTILLIESIASNLESIYDSELYLYVKSLGYTMFAKTFNTLFFRINE